MTPNECWLKVRELIGLISSIHIIEAYDGRKAKDRPKGEYATLSLHEIVPQAMPTTRRTKVGEVLESTITVPCELYFEFTVHKGRAMDLSYLVLLLNRHEACRRFLIENSIAVWGVKELKRDPKEVHQSYEDSAVPVLIIGAELTTFETTGFADKVKFIVNDELTGEVSPETTKGE